MKISDAVRVGGLVVCVVALGFGATANGHAEQPAPAVSTQSAPTLPIAVGIAPAASAPSFQPQPLPSVDSIPGGLPGAAARPQSSAAYLDLAMAQAVPRNYPRPVSEWLSHEKTFFGKLLSSGKFDVLVVPFQVSGWALDRTTRSAMTAELTAAIVRSQKLSVPDPYLVAKALGDGQRQLNPLDIYRLADAMGVKRIVSGYAGHDRKGKMTISVLVQDHVGATRDGAAWTDPTLTKKFENIAFDDETPAIQAYESLLPDVLKAIGVDWVPVVFQKSDDKPVKLQLPASPRLLLASDENAARDAYTFLLFGLLTPKVQENTRQRFAEKALLALTKLSPASPDYRVLRARTFMAMGLRMAAIKVLDAPKTDEERELRAALDGNLPEVHALASKEKNPLKRLIQKLDENRIAFDYGVVSQKASNDEVAALQLPGDIWPQIVARAFLDRDDSTQYENGPLKAILDQELPVKGHSLEDMVGSGISSGDPKKLQTMVSLSILTHGQQFLDGNATKWCCERAFHRPGPLDYLELFQAIGHSNLMRRLYFLAATQGRPQKALDFANSIDAVYKGYPQYAFERARVEEILAKSANDSEKEGLLMASYVHAFNAMYWEQGQSWLSATAHDLVLGTGIYGYYDNFYYNDVPFRPHYWSWAKGGNRQTIEENEIAALKNATSEFRALSRLFSSYRQFDPLDVRATALLSSMETRFIGAPQRNELFATDALQRGDTLAAYAFYRDNIRLAPSYWSSYEVLGKLLFEAGEADESGKVFLAYPGFTQDSGANRTNIANHAYEAGSYFYWSGRFDFAKPLYEFSVAQKSGAVSELTSALRLRLLSGDIDGAMVRSMDRAQRGNDSRAYRDFLGMLHAKGQSKAAWEGFGQLVREGKQPHIWETALVGHHMAGVAEADIVKWVQQGEFKDTGPGKNAAAVYLLRFASTDRIPSKDLAEVINALDRPIWQLDDVRKHVVRAAEDGDTGAVLGPDTNGFQASLPVGVYAKTPKHRVQSDLAYFAQAYRALKLKDYVAAKSSFDALAKLYDVTGHALHALPYYAMAAAMAGDTTGVEKKLGTIVLRKQRFDYHLAMAVLAGVAGDGDKALQSLQLARNRRPPTDARPFLTQYTFGEVAEQVAELTGNEKIHELALEWAQKNQKSEPWHSWSYAIEAKLTKNPDDRQRALAMAHYLDSKSERLSAFSKAEIDAAVQAQKGLNPFRKPAEPAAKNGAI